MGLEKFFDLITLFSPFILICFIALLSIFNQDLKAVVLAFGLFILISVLKKIGNNITLSDNYKDFCTMFGVIETPGTSSAIISFIFIYMVLPMLFNEHYNFPLITIFFILYITDFAYRAVKYKCYNMSTILLSTVLGLSLGSLYFFAIYYFGEQHNDSYFNLLYFNVSRNNLVQCSNINEKEYTCNFYNANDQVIDNITDLNFETG